MFSIQNLTHAYGGATVLNVASWRAEQGAQWLMLGPSGSGKSTLPHVLAGILRPATGQVTAANQDLLALSPAALDHFRVKHILNARFISILAVALWVVAPVYAQNKAKKTENPHTASEVQKDIGNHLAMADAHVAAAKCLQGGKAEKRCHAQLFKDCKGLGIGKLCGMKRKH